jgi:amphi-Trp domain-containing protein
MGRKKDRDVEKEYSASGFASRLRRLADAIEGGKRFTIQIRGERVSVPADAEFSIEHERVGREEEIEFGIKWTRG